MLTITAQRYKKGILPMTACAAASQKCKSESGLIVVALKYENRYASEVRSLKRCAVFVLDILSIAEQEIIIVVLVKKLSREHIPLIKFKNSLNDKSTVAITQHVALQNFNRLMGSISITLNIHSHSHALQGLIFLEMT